MMFENEFEDKAFEGWEPPPPSSFTTPTTALNPIQAIVNGAPVGDVQQPARPVVEEMYQRVQFEEEDLKRERIMGAMQAGEAEKAKAILAEKEEEVSFIKKLDKSIENAMEKITVTNPRVTQQNTPQKMGQAIQSASKKTSIETFLKLMEADLKDVGVGTYAAEFLTPNVAQGASLTSTLKELGVPSSYLQGRSRDADAVFNWLADMPEEDRGEALQKIYSGIRDATFATRLTAASFIADVLAPEAQSKREGMDTLNKLFSAFDVAEIGSIAVALRAGAKRLSTKKALATVGRKDVVEADAKDALLNGKDVSSTGLTKAEQVDVATSFNLDAVLPDGVSVAPHDIQEALKNAGKATLDDVQNTINSSGIRPEEAARLLHDTELKFSAATNPNVFKSSMKVSNDLSEIVGEVLWKPSDAAAFSTREAAERFMKERGIKGDVVENTANPGAKVSVGKNVDELKARAKALETELAAEMVKRAGKKRLQKEVDDVNALKAERDKLSKETSPLHDKGEIREAKKQLNLLEQKRPNMSDEFIRSLAKTIQAAKKVSYRTALVEARRQQAKAMQDFMARQQRLKDFIGDNARAQQAVNRLADLDKQIANLEKNPTMVDDTSVVTEKANELARVKQQINQMTDEAESLGDGYLVRQDVSEVAGLKAVGKFNEADKGSSAQGLFGRFAAVFDPALKGSKELMTQRVVGLHKESRINKALTDLVEEKLGKLSREERISVEDALRANDAETNGGSLTREYSYTELKGRMMTNSAIEAFYRVRLARNIMHKIKDGEAALSLRNKGFMELSIERANVKGFARKLDKEELLRRYSGRKIYNVEDGKLHKVDEALDNDVYFEFESPVSIDGKDRKIVKVNPNDAVTGRIDTVVPYRAGEMQRIYEDPFFVRLHWKGNADEGIDPFHVAHKTARTRKEAEGYARDFWAAIQAHRAGKLTREEAERLLSPWNEDVNKFISDASNGRYDDLEMVKPNVSRSKEDYLQDYTTFARGVRGFTKGRHEKLSTVDKDVRSNILSPLESLQAEITNVSRVASLTQWRDAAVQRWFNEVFDHLDPELKKLSPEEAFFKQMEKGRYFGTNHEQKFAQDVEQYLKFQLNLRTKEDQFWEGVAHQVADSIEGSEKLARWGVGNMVRKASPLSFVRSLNFHLMLGSFNPAQIIVQTQNLVTMAAVSPRHGVQSAKSAMMLRMALASDNEKVWRHLAKADSLLELGMKNADEFVDTVKAVKRSGILDGINSTSMYTQEAGKFFVFNRNVERVKGASGFFFNRGEEITRLSAFDLARREFMEANPGKLWNSDEGLKAIIGRQDDLTQNMTRANVAAYQRGLLSIPAQFLQYNLKLAANMIGGTFGERGYTPAQSARIMAVHLAAYGAAGSGLGMMVKEFLGDNIPEDWDEEKRLYVVQGAFAGLINSLSLAATGTETKLALGTRLGTFNFYSDFVGELLSEDSNFLEIMAGPSSKLYEVSKGLYTIGKMWVRSPLSFEANFNETLYTVLQNSSSSLSNATKAYIAHNYHNTIMSKDRKPLAEVTDSEKWFQAIGIPPASIADVNTLYNTKKNYDARMKDLTKEVRSLHSRIGEALAKGDEVEADEYAKHLNIIYNGVTIEEAQRLREATYGINLDTALKKNLAEYLQRKMGERTPLTTEDY